MQAFARRYPRAFWYGVGTGLSAAAGWFVAEWSEIFNDWLGLQVTYDARPPWLRMLMVVAEWSPWVVLALLVTIRARRGRIVRPLAYALGAATPYVALGTFLLIGPTVEDRFRRERFDAAGWRRNTGENTLWPARLRMVDDLVAHHPLRGLTRDSVAGLLGEKDSTSSWKEWDVVYWLGPERGLIRIDSEWLVLRYGADNRVTDWRIVRD